MADGNAAVTRALNKEGLKRNNIPEETQNALKQAQKLNAEGKTVLLDIHTNLEARRSNFA